MKQSRFSKKATIGLVPKIIVALVAAVLMILVIKGVVNAAQGETSDLLFCESSKYKGECFAIKDGCPDDMKEADTSMQCTNKYGEQKPICCLPRED